MKRWYIINFVVLALSACAGEKNVPPPVTVIVATAEEAKATSASRGVSLVVIDQALKPVQPPTPARVETTYNYEQWRTNYYAVDTEGKRVIIDGDNRVVSYQSGSLSGIIPGGGQPANSWYQPPPQDPPAVYPYINYRGYRYYRRR